MQTQMLAHTRRHSHSRLEVRLERCQADLPTRAPAFGVALLKASSHIAPGRDSGGVRLWIRGYRYDVGRSHLDGTSRHTSLALLRRAAELDASGLRGRLARERMAALESGGDGGPGR